MDDPRPPVVLESPAPAASADNAADATTRSPRFAATEESTPTDRSPSPWGRNLVLGGSFGLGAPAGLAGLMAQINPSTFWGLELAGGVGTLGTAAAAQAWLRPIPPAGEWLPVLGAGVSVNVISKDQRDLPDRDLPLTARWLNVEVASEWRVRSGRMVRFGVGHSFLLNGGDFRCRTAVEGACQAASENNTPGWAPYGGGVLQVRDLIVSQQQDRLVHLWYLHVDFGALVPF